MKVFVASRDKASVNLKLPARVRVEEVEAPLYRDRLTLPEVVGWVTATEETLRKGVGYFSQNRAPFHDRAVATTELAAVTVLIGAVGEERAALKEKLRISDLEATALLTLQRDLREYPGSPRRVEIPRK